MNIIKILNIWINITNWFKRLASYTIYIVFQNNYKEHKININLFTRSVIKTWCIKVIRYKLHILKFKTELTALFSEVFHG